jgi:uncharacterized protein (TIGR03067 family)
VPAKETPPPPRPAPVAPLESPATEPDEELLDVIPVPSEPEPLDRGEKDTKASPEAPPAARGRHLPVILVGGGAAVLVLVGIGVGFLLRSPQTSDPAVPVAAAKLKGSGGTTGEASNPAPATTGEEKRTGDPKATPAAGATLDAKGVARIKQATVYLKVTMKNGTSAEGTGFFAAEPGHVLTNAHVVGMLEPNASPPKKIDVVLNSGEKNEVKRTGRVLGVDRTSDLAVVRVEGDDKQLPPPLPVEVDLSGLSELQKVSIFGFPLGAGLGKEITVSESSIASLRKDSDGLLYQIQLNGGMHPGNSGGPIVDGRGVVIGVAVAGIRGTTINFAIPGSKIQEMLYGRVLDMRLDEPYLEQQQLKLPVHVALLDPLNRIREVHVEYWTGPNGPARPATRTPPTPATGDTPRQKVALSYNQGHAKHDLPLGAASSGQVHWLQPTFVDQAGNRRWGAAIAFKPSGAPPLQRVPVNLTVNTSSQERTLNLTSKLAFVMSKGKDRLEFAEHMELALLESLAKNANGDEVKLRMGKGTFYSMENRRRVQGNPVAQNAVRKNVYTFQADDTGRLTRFSFVTHKLSNPALTEEANDMSANVTTSYQATCLGMPNRQVAPLETWDTKIRVLVGTSKKKDPLDVVLTCTYEGCRTVNEKTEALIRLAGELRVVNAGPAIRQPNERVSGYALFDTAAGMVTRLHLDLRTEVVTETNALIARIFAFDLSRVAGNTLGIPATGDPPTDPVPVAGPNKVDPKATFQATELRRFQGRWQKVRQEVGGSEIGDVSKHEMLITGTELSMLFNGRVSLKAQLAIDPRKSPRSIDLQWTQGSSRGQKSFGIYRFIGARRLEICVNQPTGKDSGTRPTRFTTTPNIGSGSILYVFEKEDQTAAKTAPATRPDPKDEPSAQEIAKAEATANLRLRTARELFDKGKIGAAKDRLREIIRDFPNTKAAAEAERLLQAPEP